jgi:hypothetical protein
MKKAYKIFWAAVMLFLFSQFALAQYQPATTYAPDEAVCQGCHEGLHGVYFSEFMKTGHPYKLNPIDPQNPGPPTYPANTSPGVPQLPSDTLTWADIAYVIGGYGWKARFVKTNGYIYTDNDSAQYNLYGDEAAGTKWVPYHQGELKKYDYNCFKCHTTGADTSGSWPEGTTGWGTFVLPGVRCQGCHGPAQEHANDPSTYRPPLAVNSFPSTADSLEYTHCGECHQRGGKTNLIPVSKGFIRHHEQYNEMQASKHRDMGLTCATCHNLHEPLRYEAAADTTKGKPIVQECESCHPNHNIQFELPDGSTVNKPIDCENCHMPDAGKSALGMTLGNGFKGDVPTHLWKINTAAVPRDSMFTADGYVKLDATGHGAVTLDFVCLSCHNDDTIEWASTYATGIHNAPLKVDMDKPELAVKYELHQNYPNPFNPTTTIRFTIPRSVKVELFVFDITGRRIKTLVSKQMPAGTHAVQWDGTDNSGKKVASGIYFYQIKAGNYVDVKRMALVK